MRIFTGNKEDSKMSKKDKEEILGKGLGKSGVDETQKVLERLTPMLEGWLHKSLETLGGEFNSESRGNKKVALPIEGKTRAASKQREGKPQTQADNKRTTSGEEMWSQVIGRKAKNKAAKTKSDSTKSVASSNTKGQTEDQKRDETRQHQTAVPPKQQQKRELAGEVRGSQKKAPKRRPPRTAAVTLTCPSGYNARSEPRIR